MRDQKEPVVSLVDDDPDVRTALFRVLDSSGWYVQTYASGEEFLEEYDNRSPGCVVLDVRMPGVSGLTVQERLNRQEALIPIVFITGFSDLPAATQALKGGALDMIEKPFSEKEILAAVERAVAFDARRRRLHEEQTLIQDRLARLTPREREVLQLVVCGRLNKQIGHDLGISERTVEVHRRHVFEKMEVESAVELLGLVHLVLGGSPATAVGLDPSALEELWR